MAEEWEIAGTKGAIVGRTWSVPDPRYVAVLVHGYGEHIGRYEHVAAALNRHGAVVHGADHMGHGRSEGDRVFIEDYEDVVSDVHSVADRARAADPGLPFILIGHSMGGMIAARYAQRHGDELTGLVLSGPVIGSWRQTTSLLELSEIPFVPIDVSTLSRDESVGEAYAEDPLVWHGPFKRTLIAALDTCLTTINHGPTLTMPTLWVHGEDDQLVPLPESRDGVLRVAGDDLTERIYPGARHEVFNEIDKDVVLADVTDFIDRLIT